MTTPAPPAAVPAAALTAAAAAADSALAAQLATALIQAVNAEEVMARTLRYSRAARISPAAMVTALQLVMSMPQEVTGASGPASLAVIRENHLRRAQFAIASGRRMTSAVLSARSLGETARSALSSSVPQERRYFGQHIEAAWNRARAAAQVDQAYQVYGGLLGWYSVRDRATSAECRAADHGNFSVDRQPAIGWPGSVHPHCRCYPGAPVPGGRMLATFTRPTVRSALRARVGARIGA
jgi:hypothetical protein